MRLFPIATLFAAAALAAVPARAGETAEALVLGFADNGRLFAFEEYGVQDGSGFPYANIFVVDTDDDSWLPGTPIRVRLDDETASVADARSRAEAQLASAVDADFAPQDAVTLAHSPLGEFEQNPARLVFGPVVPSNPLSEPAARYEARLDIFSAEAEAKDCETYIGDRPMGFRLTISPFGGGDGTMLHEDDTIPASRGCPITYRLSRIVVPGFPPQRVAVLVSVFTPGFEGPDRHFIAVTGRLPD